MGALRPKLTTLAVSLGAFLVCVHAATAASLKDVATFDSPLFDQAIWATSCEQPCPTEASQPISGGLAVNRLNRVAGVPEIDDLLLSDAAAALLKDGSSSSERNDDEGILQIDPRRGIKRFLLAVLFLGGLFRFLTSVTYGKFVAEVLDPLSW